MRTYIEKSVGEVDRAGWPAGEWDEEPDKLVWVDEVTALDCMIHRNRMGGLCGYVAVGPDHPWYGVAYRNIQDEPDVHGGLTYAGACDEASGLCHVPQPGRPADVWWFGFDCGHFMDVMPYVLTRDWLFGPPLAYRNIEYVTAEVESLAKQLAEVG